MQSACVLIVAGGMMACHAAANIAMAVENFKNRGYAALGGIIVNRRDIKNEEEKVRELAEDVNTEIIGTLNRSTTVQEAEELGKTVIEAFPDSEMAKEYRRLAESILRVCRKEDAGA